MAAELALIDILRDDVTLGALLGGTGTDARVYPFDRAEGSALPAIIVRGQDIEPSDTKDGVSTLDSEFIQVLIQDSNINQLLGTIEPRVRTLCDRVSGGTYNTVVIQSSRFEDRDTWSERLDNKEIYTVEHIYKVRVKR
jgi:hypothetical protein